MNIARDFLRNYSTVTDQEWAAIESLFEPVVYQRNKMILEIGQVCRYFYLFEEGLLRFFYMVEGEDVTKTFTLAPYVFTSRASFRKQEPSQEGIQALERTVVRRIRFADYPLLEKHDCWRTFMRKIQYEIQEFSDALLLETKTMTAEARYIKLLDDYPADLIQKIPLNYLASFLGIAPQSLSRIRKKMHEQRNS